MLNKNQESKKGYWTDDEVRGLSISVTASSEDTARISLSSAYWYRVQHFDLQESTSEEAWRVIRATLKECGRTLVLHAPPTPAPEREQVEEEEDDEEENDETAAAAAATNENKDEVVTPAPGVHYEVPYLSAKQVDQIYYLLKHNLTTEKVGFSISHSIRFDSSKGTLAPSKRRRRRKKKVANRPSPARWQTVGKR